VSDQELLMMQLEKCYPEDKSLSPIEMRNLFEDFFAKRGFEKRIKIES